jgi:hypothetical protein
MAVQKLTPVQMFERRKKGLCYHCDERWSVGHKCKTMKLYIMEGVEEEEEVEDSVEEEAELIVKDEEPVEITLYALLGSSSPLSMRVVACINGHKAIVLIDTGSTHNFLDNNLAKSLKLVIDTTSCFRVKVANGEESKPKENARQSSSRCKA